MKFQDIHISLWAVSIALLLLVYTVVETIYFILDDIFEAELEDNTFCTLCSEYDVDHGDPGAVLLTEGGPWINRSIAAYHARMVKLSQLNHGQIPVGSEALRSL